MPGDSGVSRFLLVAENSPSIGRLKKGFVFVKKKDVCILPSSSDRVLKHGVMLWAYYRERVRQITNPNTVTALDISTGPPYFSDRRTCSGQYILSFTGPYGPPRYMSGHYISHSAGPNDDKSQYVLFAQASVSHLSSFRAVLLLQPDASGGRVGVGLVNQTC